MSSPQRPRLWIHRTRRFWVGLLLLIGLIVGLMWVGSYRWSATYSPPSTILDTTRSSDYELSLIGGGIEFEKSVWTFPASYPWAIRSTHDWSFETDTQQKPIVWRPEWLNMGLGHSRFGPEVVRVFIPLWPLPILWAIVWPIWMIRAERRELKAYGESP
jgi:hypothetical protein